jgi:RNA polymerase sigma factor (sigma-70 family)
MGYEDAAFHGLYAEHSPGLLRLATVLTGGDRGRAEDLVQETMLRAWTHRASMDIQHRSPRPWLVTTARRLAVDAYRARRARPQEVELDEALTSPGGQRADAGLDEVGVRAAIAAFRPAPSDRTFYALRALRRVMAADDAVAQLPERGRGPAAGSGNVTANALRYSPAGSPPLVTVSARGDRTEVRVAGRGPGVAHPDRDRMFEPFQRLGDASTTTGVGLGLAVSRGLTEAMRGTLEPEETPGRGPNHDHFAASGPKAASGAPSPAYAERDGHRPGQDEQRAGA